MNNFAKNENKNCCVNLTTKIQSNGHDCFSPQPKGKLYCPKCYESAKGVLAKTLEHLLTDISKSKLDSLDGFHYCKTSTCEVIYFKEDKVLTQKDLNVVVGLKEGAIPANMCYCFGWTKERMREDIDKNGTSTALENIKYNMKTIGCSCEIKNPSGYCCMADVGKFVKDMTML